MSKYFLIIFSFAVYFFLCFSCAQKQKPTQNYLSFKIPKGWPKPFYDFKNNALTDLRFELGKKLFYDKRLSVDGTISCESCHHQSMAFADAGKTVSVGITSLNGTRNTPGLFNLAWNKTFMWDGGVNHIEFQPIVPITSEIEMGENLEAVILKIRNDKIYKQLFKDAYDSDSITSQLLLRAFAQFLGTLVSADSKYDKVRRGENKISFSNSEQSGYTLFQQNCVTCHKEPLFTDYSFRNNGIGIDELKDPGRFVITQVPSDSLKFKVPSLRNIQFTAPYMHDGRFKTLEEVLDYYSTSVKHKNSDTEITRITNLSQFEKKELISFLKTLSDSSFLSNPHYKE
jgi:cytochrome c peroxidase